MKDLWAELVKVQKQYDDLFIEREERVKAGVHTPESTKVFCDAERRLNNQSARIKKKLGILATSEYLVCGQCKGLMRPTNDNRTHDFLWCKQHKKFKMYHPKPEPKEKLERVL